MMSTMLNERSTHRWHLTTHSDGSKSPCRCVLATGHADEQVGYLPEPWNVVRDDGLIVISAAAIADAEDAALFLNSNNRLRKYELVLGDDLP